MIGFARIAVTAAIAASSFVTGAGTATYEAFEDESFVLGYSAASPYGLAGRLTLPIDPATGQPYPYETRSIAVNLPVLGYAVVELTQAGVWSLRGPATDAEMRTVYGPSGLTGANECDTLARPSLIRECKDGGGE